MPFKAFKKKKRGGGEEITSIVDSSNLTFSQQCNESVTVITLITVNVCAYKFAKVNRYWWVMKFKFLLISDHDAWKYNVEYNRNKLDVYTKIRFISYLYLSITEEIEICFKVY